MRLFIFQGYKTVADLVEGTRGARGSTLFWVKKKEEMREGENAAGQVNQDTPPPLPPPSLSLHS